MTSLGRVGRILAGSIDPSSMSIDREYFANTSSSQQQQQLQQQIAQQQQRLQQTQLTHSGSSSTISSIKSASVPPGPIEASSSRASVPSNAATTSMSETVTSAFDKPVTLQEPDVIASTKLAHSKTTDSITSSGPIAPPRRKKKSKKGSSSSSEHFNMNEGMRLQAPDTDTDSDTRSVKSVRDVQQRLRDDLVKEIEKSWNETSSLQNSMSGGSCSGASGALSAGTGGGNGITTSATMPMTLGGLSALGGNVSSACSSGNVSSNTVVSASGTSLSQISTCNARPVTTAAIGGSINRISHSLGNSSTSVYSKPSPSNSSKSNSAPGRVR